MSVPPFKILFRDDQRLWSQLAPLLLPNIPLEHLAVSIPAQLLVGTRSTPISGTATFREVTLPSLDLVFENAVDHEKHFSQEYLSIGTREEDDLLSWLQMNIYMKPSEDPPVCNLFLFTCESFDVYKTNVRNAIKKWSDSLADNSEEMLILFVTPQEAGVSVETSRMKAQRKTFERVKVDLESLLTNTVYSSLPTTGTNAQARSSVGPGRTLNGRRIFRLPTCDAPSPHERTVAVWKGLPRNDPAIFESWEAFLERFAECVSAGTSQRLSLELQMKETLQLVTPAKPIRSKYTTVFHAAENMTLSLMRCKLYPEVLCAYDNLDLRLADSNSTAKRYRTLFHSCGLPVLGSEPLPFHFDPKIIRQQTEADSISYVDFRQYLFTRQCQTLFAMGRIDKLCMRSQLFLCAFAQELQEFAASSVRDKLLKIGAVRTFLLLFAHNLSVRLLALADRDSIRQTENRNLNRLEACVGELWARFTHDAQQTPMRTSSRMEKTMSESQRDLRDTMTTAATLEYFAIQQFYELLSWRTQDEWRSLFGGTPRQIVWAEVLKAPLTSIHVGFMLEDLARASTAATALFQHTASLLEASSHHRQLIVLQINHQEIVQRYGLRCESRILDKRGDKSLSEIALVAAESAESALILLASLSLNEPSLMNIAGMQRSLLVFLLWALAGSKPSSKIHLLRRRLAAGLVKNDWVRLACLDTIKPAASLLQALTKCPQTPRGSRPILPTVGCVQNVINLRKKSPDKMAILRTLPALPCLRVCADLIRASTGLSVLTAESDPAHTSFKELDLDEDSSEDPLRVYLDALGEEYGMQADDVRHIPPPNNNTGMKIDLTARHASHRNSYRSVEEGSADHSSAGGRRSTRPQLCLETLNLVKDRVVTFGEPLVFQFLIQSDLSESLVIRQAFLQISLSELTYPKAPESPTSPLRSFFSSNRSMTLKLSRKATLSASDSHHEHTLWISIVPKSGELIVNPRGTLSYLSFWWTPLIGGSMKLKRLLLFPAQGPLSFRFETNLARPQLSFPLLTQAKLLLHIIACRQASKKRSRQSSSKESHQLTNFQVMPPKSPFTVSFSLLHPALAREMTLAIGIVNFVQIKIEVNDFSKVTGVCKVVLQAKTVRGHKHALKASILHSHVCAIAVDGRDLATVETPHGRTISPTSRAIPTGVAISGSETTASTHWLGLPQFQKSIILVAPLSLFSESSVPLVVSDFSPEATSPSLSSAFSLEPAVSRDFSERQKSDITSEVLRSPSRYILPRVPATTRHKEAAVLVPRHVRSPSVRSGNTRMLCGLRLGGESPGTQELQKTQSASASGRTTPEAQPQIQLFLRLRVTAAVAGLADAGLVESEEFAVEPITQRIVLAGAAGVDGLRIRGMGPVATETCLERQPNAQEGFPKLSEVTHSTEGNYLADQTVNQTFSVLRLFATSTSNAAETDRFRLDTIRFAFHQPLENLTFRAVLLKSVSLAWPAQGPGNPPSKRFEVDFFAPDGLLKLTAQGEEVRKSLANVEVQHGKDFQGCMSVKYTDTYDDLSISDWEECATAKVIVKIETECKISTGTDSPRAAIAEALSNFVGGCANVDCYKVATLMEIPLRPGPLAVSRVKWPSTAQVFTPTQLTIEVKNITKFPAKVRFNVLLPFDIDVEFERDDLGILYNPAELMCRNKPHISPEEESGRAWQLTGWKCGSRHIPPLSTEVMTFNLIPLVTGKIPLPPVKAIGWLLSPDSHPQETLTCVRISPGQPLLANPTQSSARVLVYPRWPTRARLSLLRSRTVNTTSVA